MQTSQQPPEGTLEQLEIELGADLERAFQGVPPGDGPPEAEDAIMGAFDAHHASSADDTPHAPIRWPRLAIAAGLGLCIVGACAVPATYQVSMGLTVEVDAPALDETEIREVSTFIREHGDVDSIDVSLERSTDENGTRSHLSLHVWGEHLDAPALADDLQAQYPFLADADVRAQPLEAAIDTNWGGLALRRLVPGELSSDKERARARILEQLAAQGVEGDVKVEVSDGPNGREVRVEVRREEHDDR